MPAVTRQIRVLALAVGVIAGTVGLPPSGATTVYFYALTWG